MIKFTVHYGIHFVVPLLIAFIFFKEKWLTVYLIAVATMLIDLDHLLATPIFDPNRCSINYHPLHSYYAIAVYVILFFFKKTRVLAIGLLVHMLADYVDCFL